MHTVKILKAIIVIVLFVIALALGAQNQEVVSFNYLIAQGEFQLSILLGMVFLAAFILAWLIFGSVMLKNRVVIRRLNKQIKKLTPIDSSNSKEISKS
jgi:putative membrane protein